MKLNRKNALIVALLSTLATPSAIAQETRSWNSNGTSNNPWLTLTNWSPNTNFAGGAPMANPAGEGANTDIMGFAEASTGNNVGINMNTLAAGGGVGLILGGIDFARTSTNAFTIGNSSTVVSGILQLNGATINAVDNTLIRVNSGNLTITNVGTGATNAGQTLGLRLGITNGIFEVASGRTLTIASIISQAEADSGFTKTGTGTLTLTGLNTHTGVTTLTAGTLSINRFTDGGVAGSLGMASNAAANLVMTGGTLTYTGTSATTDRGITFGALSGNPIISVSTGGTNLDLTNVIAGTASQQIDFTKGGVGTLTLSNNNNSYIGRTFVSGGTLAVTSISAVGSSTSSIGVATSPATGLISIGTGVTTTTLSYLGTGNTTDRDLNLPGTAGGAVIEQAGTGLLKFTGAVGATGVGSKTLTLRGSTLGTGEIAGVIVDNGTTGSTVATTASTASTALVLGSVVGLTIGDAITGTGIPDATTITAINPATRTVTLSAAATVAANAVISSPGLVNLTSVAKDGTGTWTLTGANTYTGETKVTAGTLDLGGGAATGSLASTTLTLAGGTFAYTRTGNTTQSFTSTQITAVSASHVFVAAGNTLNLGTVTRALGGSADFSMTGPGTVAAATASNVGGIIPGSTFGNTWAVANGDGVAISGLGSYTLTSVAGTTAANYTGNNIDVNSSAGTLSGPITANSVRFSAAAANTMTLAGSPNLISSGGILVTSGVGANLSTIAGGDLAGAPDTGLTVIQNNTLGGLTISSAIADNGGATGFTKSGPGLLTLAGANTYTGATVVAAGTLQLSGAGTLSSGPVAVNEGAVLDLNGTDQSITFAAGTGVGTVANNSGSGTSVLTILGTTSPINGALTTIVDSTTNPGGKVAVVITRNTQPMSNLNTYSGGTTVNEGAFFYVNGASSLGAGTGPISLPASGATTSVSSGLLVDGGATYANDVSGPGYVHNNTNGAGTAVLTGTLNTSGTFNFRNANAAFEFAGSGNSTLSGVIGPVGGNGIFGPNTTVAGGSVIKSGTGTLTLSGNNVFSGSLSVRNGVLAIPVINNASTAGPLGNSANAVTLGSSGNTGTLRYTGESATSTKRFALAADGTGAIEVTTAATDLGLAGVISGSGAMTKTGPGTLTLTAVNTYTGNTEVSAGALVLADGAQLRFVLGATSGTNNTLTGAGTATLDGDFNIDTTAADALSSGTWTLENVATLTGGYGPNFTVLGFTDAGGNKWTKANGASKTYTFDETTGILTLSSSASYASWISGFFPGETNPAIIGATADPDNDGIGNASEMVLGGNPATGMDTALLPTLELVTNPAGVPAGNYFLFTFRRSDLSVAAGLTATCETDTDLVAPWTPAVNGTAGVVILTDDNFTFTPPATADTDRVRVYVPRGANPKLFGRLNVTVP